MIAELQQLKPTVRNNYLCPITTFTCAHTPKKSQVEVVHVPEKPPMRKSLSSQFDSPQPDNVSVTAESNITDAELLSQTTEFENSTADDVRKDNSDSFEK